MMRFQTLLTLVAVLYETQANPVFDPQRIVGGELAEEHEFPHQISLKLNERGHICGGSIIADKWIATAAHCLKGQDVASLYITWGTNHQATEGLNARIKNYVIHEKYNGVTNNNYDFGLIELPFGILDSTSEIIKIGKGEPPVATCTLSGWGAVNGQGGGDTSQQNDLRKITLRYVDHDECYRSWQWNFVYINDESQICTDSMLDSGVGSPCFGDSGGPLICEQDGEMKQFGVVSFGVGHCSQSSPKRPAVYGQISNDGPYNWYNEKCGGCLGDRDN